MHEATTNIYSPCPRRPLKTEQSLPAGDRFERAMRGNPVQCRPGHHRFHSRNTAARTGTRCLHFHWLKRLARGRILKLLHRARRPVLACIDIIASKALPPSESASSRHSSGVYQAQIFFFLSFLQAFPFVSRSRFTRFVIICTCVPIIYANGLRNPFAKVSVLLASAHRCFCIIILPAVRLRCSCCTLLVCHIFQRYVELHKS